MSNPANPTRGTVRRLPLTKARINLGAVIKRVRVNKEYVILEKDGFPVAGLMDIDEFEDYLELQDAAVKRDVAASARDARAGRSRPAGKLLAELRAADRRVKTSSPRGRRRARG